MPTWDRLTPQQQAKIRDAALRRQLRDGVGPFSPFWRERFSALRVPAASIEHAADLTKLPAVGERDVCPTGDPKDAARLVLQADEAGFALHTFGPDLRKALVQRLAGQDRYRRHVEAEVRPTTFHLAGRAMTFPVASTRNDLDVVARAGARAWQVLGLTSADVLVSAVPPGPTLEHTFLTYAALGAGAPAVFALDALGLVPATVLAIRPEDLDLLDGVEVPQTLLLVGTYDEAARQRAEATGRRVVALWAPPEHRVMWAECSPGNGWHTYPDIDLVEVVDPETGKPARTGELVLTQLGLRGSALLRWRTGDLVEEPVATSPCPGCGRTVPRIPSAVRTSAMHVSVSLRHGDEHLDLRAIAAALEGRADVIDWMVEVVPSPREHDADLLVLVATDGDETDAAVGVWRDVRSVAGLPPSQVVVLSAEELAHRRDSGAPRVVVRN